MISEERVPLSHSTPLRATNQPAPSFMSRNNASFRHPSLVHCARPTSRSCFRCRVPFAQRQARRRGPHGLGEIVVHVLFSVPANHWPRFRAQSHSGTDYLNIPSNPGFEGPMTTQSVPEPSTLVLGMFNSLGGLACFRRGSLGPSTAARPRTGD